MITTLIAAAASLVIVTSDQTALKASPKASSQTHAQLWQGEALEVRGERMDYVQVYDYRRERGGYVRASQLRRIALSPEHAPELLSVVRFLKDRPGSESLGIAYAAAYIQAAPPVVLNGETGVEMLDAIGGMADRLARTKSKFQLEHLEVARSHGIRFVSQERENRVVVCYEGEAFRRVLAMKSSPEQRARASLALTRRECAPDDLRPTERRKTDEWRAELLDQVEPEALPPYIKNRVLMRRAAVWSSLAWQRARAGEAAATAGARALLALGGVNKTELADDDTTEYADAAMRVNASRWSLSPPPQPAADKRPGIVTQAGQPGETCILLVNAKNGAQKPLARRCTYGIVWASSASANREGTAVAVAVQPTDAWREMWVFRKSGKDWSVRVLPPAATHPEVGYAEFAGWIPGGNQVLVAREARGEGRYRRNFELVRLDNLATVGQAPDPSLLSAFARWQDPQWKRSTVSLR